MFYRVIFVVSRNEPAELPMFIKHFPSVEERCKVVMGECYIPVPLDCDLVESVMTVMGVSNIDIFMEEGDQCCVEILHSVVAIPVKNGILWPVIIVKNKNLLFCTLPAITKHQFLNRDNLKDLPCVSVAFQMLQGIAAVCENSQSRRTEKASNIKVALAQHINISLPFGRAAVTDPFISNSIIHAVSKSNAKNAMWNPIVYRGKPDVSIHIREVVDFMQFGQCDVIDNVTIHGTLICTALLEGICPEISFILHHPCSKSKNLIVSSATVSFEKKNEFQTQLRFKSCRNLELCHYFNSRIVDPPMHGDLRVSIVNNVATVNLKLQLQKSVTNTFARLEALIPFQDLKISGVKHKQTTGSTMVRDTNVLMWDIGTKFPTATVTAELNAIVVFTKSKSEDLNVIQNGFCQNNFYAMINFKISGYCYSGTKVDHQSISLSVGGKKRISLSNEFVSGTYKIFSNANQEVINFSSLKKSLQDCTHVSPS